MFALYLYRKFFFKYYIFSYLHLNSHSLAIINRNANSTFKQSSIKVNRKSLPLVISVTLTLRTVRKLRNSITTFRTYSNAKLLKRLVIVTINSVWMTVVPLWTFTALHQTRKQPLYTTAQMMRTTVNVNHKDHEMSAYEQMFSHKPDTDSLPQLCSVS